MPKSETNKDNETKPSEIDFERFEQYSALPIGLGKYVTPDLIGTPLEDIDPFYKEKQVPDTKVIHYSTLKIDPAHYKSAISVSY